MTSKFEKSKKYIVIILFLIASVFAVIFMGRVAINYNISDYLDDRTETKISLNIIESEFGSTADVQVMIENIGVDEAKSVKDTLKGIENVLTVNFDESNPDYYKDGKALFVALVDGDEYSEQANAVVEDIRTALEENFAGNVHYGGAIMEKANLRKSIETEIPFVLGIALCLVVAIMLLTSKSWIEPFLLLFASGVAVLINMGTNVLFGEISYITNAVAAILQLALSVDYSIVLLHSYRKLKEKESDKHIAMYKAVKEVLKPVSASALTTMAGLFALLFMSMKIGFDIGTVLMKGIVISAIVSLTLLPAILLVFEKPLKRTKKTDIELNGEVFCEKSVKWGRSIVSIALAIVIVCGVLQFGNTYLFTDSNKTNSAINDVFGRNNSVVVVYENTENNHENEKALIEKLNAYQISDGQKALKGYTAYSNTVREPYDVNLAVRKLQIPKSDVELLFTMYHLYQDSQLLRLKPIDFFKSADEIIARDADAAGFADEGLSNTIRMMLVIDEIMNGEHTAEEFHTLASTGVMEGTGISLFAVEQMYGLYAYDSIPDKTIQFSSMVEFVNETAHKPEFSDMVDGETLEMLSAFADGVKQLKELAEKPLTVTEFRQYAKELADVEISEIEAKMIFALYFGLQGQGMQETIPLLKLITFFAEQGWVADAETVALIQFANELYEKVTANYSYEEFLPALIDGAEDVMEFADISGVEFDIDAEDPAIQQLIQQVYIMYFNENGMVPETRILGREFVEFIKSTAETNVVVGSQVSEDVKVKLEDMCVVDEFLSDTNLYDFKEMTAKIAQLQNNIQSVSISGSIAEDKVSGVYIKHAVGNGNAFTEAIEAKDILNFVLQNVDSNEFLSAKMSEDKRAKLLEAQASISSATDLFISENYSRMILSINLESESAESSAFVAYLLGSVKEVFGDGAHIAGEMVSTYDLQNTFDGDNMLITIFTIISIFVIVMLIFRSLSLPIILVAIIQGSIWIAMSTSLLTGSMFFMSYIMATCILMGATIDYGILMATTYVRSREELSKKDSLYKAVGTALPTVFTSGLILTICGFVIGVISSQNAIATVGILLGKGTLVSIVMIMLVLPAVLFLLDGFVLKFTLKSKKK